MTTRVAIDLNVRVRGNQTYAGFEDVDGVPVAGAPVEVYEAETGLAGPGRITEIDEERQLVYLAVDWAKLRDPSVTRPTQEPWLTALLEKIAAALEFLDKQVNKAIERSRAGASGRSRSMTRRR